MKARNHAVAVPASPLKLQAGPLTLEFVRADGSLRDVRLGGAEVLRGITAPVRDSRWGTVAPRVEIASLRQGADSFEVGFDVVCREGEIDFVWSGSVAGTREGRVVYRFAGRARSHFLKNRIGLCVLHGAQCAGAACEIEHHGGGRTSGRFPTEISPHQPFLNIRQIAHEYAPGRRAVVRFEGGRWEMEDQRNWTDASFKTYCPPLEDPFPVAMQPGDEIRQEVMLTLVAPWPENTHRAGPPLVVIKAEPLKLPALGFRWRIGDLDPLTARQRMLISALRADHLRVDLDPFAEEQMASAAAGVRAARELGVSLEVALHVDESDPEALLRRLPGWLAEQGRDVKVRRWLALGKSHPVLIEPGIIAAIRDGVRALPIPEAPLILGSDLNFAELNRNRPPHGTFDGLGFAANPQVHAFDDRALIETLEMLSVTTGEARRIGAGAPVHVSTLTLRPSAGSRRDGGRGGRDTDPRQQTPFGAAWTLGALAALVRGGAASATCFDVRGGSGLITAETDANRMGSYPLYHVFASWAEAVAENAWTVATGSPWATDAVALRTETGVRLLLANFRDSEQEVVIEGLGVVWAARRLVSPPAAPEAGWQTVSEIGARRVLLQPHQVLELNGAGPN